MRTHTPVELKHPDCQLNTEPFYQCCCTCIYRRPVHFHCCTEPKPTEEQKKAAGVEGRCVCGVQKGWVCACPMSDDVFDNWPEHSCGCELHTTREDKEKWEAQKEADRKELEAFRAAVKAMNEAR